VGPGAGEEVLLFAKNANGCDLSGCVRDALVLAVPAAPRCAAPACAAGPPPPPPPAPSGNAFASLAALRDKLSSPQ
jgi:hypothetical protein